MEGRFLDSAVEGVTSLQAVFITSMPDCLLFDSWVSNESSWSVEEVAAYFGDLVRANREGLKTLGSWSSEMQVTIESADRLIMLTEINENFVCTCVFDKGVPLGMARLNLRKVLERVSSLLPTFEVEEKPRGARIIDFLHRYAPDPHAVMLRVSLRTGISVEDMGNPEQLSDEQVSAVESATKRILGLQSLSV